MENIGLGTCSKYKTAKASTYRYAFNGKERDPEGMGGGGSTYDYGFRIYNPRWGKFLSVDPLTKAYPWYTPYQFAGNRPINAIDLDGLEEWETITEIGNKVKPVLSRWAINAEGKLVQGGQLAGRTLGTAFAALVLVFTPVDNGSGAHRAAFSNSLNREDQQRYNDLAYKKSQNKLTDQEKRDFQDLEDQKFPHGKPSLLAPEKPQDNSTHLEDLVGHRKDHILNRHRSGADKPEKTEFPSDWSDERIINEVNKIANDPTAVTGAGKWDSPYKIGTVDGIEIRVDFYPSAHPQYSGKVSTAYPTNVPPNPPKP